ncbi:MAG TPA: TonB-dependent receptor [Rhizomicrobium sp.]|nr:TonB-dependent receptor [Rhizomicrobium sp.]
MTLRSAFACAAAIAAISTSGPLFAQEAQQTQSDPIETVVVTGVRASVKSSLEVKKKADQLVDSIVAEDIGKLPDNNVIEALQHVTGVQISRNAAEANQLLIRGLPDVATVLNGREIFTSTGRFVTLQDIPAELLARVDVEKSPRADDIEGGIAGLIDVRLHRPFDFDGLEIAGTMHGTHSSLSDNTDPDASFLISDRWSTKAGEIGLLVDLSFRRDRYKEEILDNYISTQGIGPVNGSTGAGGVAFVPLTEGAQSIHGDRQRTAANVALQWAPNENTELYAEVFYTRYRNPNNVDFFVGLPWICADASTATVFPGTDLVKTVTGGCYDLTSDQSFVPKTDTYQAATGGTWTSGQLTLSTEFDYTDSRFSQVGVILDTEYYPPGNGYTADFNYHNSGTPYMNVTGIDLLDPSQYHFRQFYDQRVRSYGNEVDWRGDLNYDLGDSGFFKSIVGGLRYVNRFANNRQANGGGLDCRGNDPTGPGCFTDLASLSGAAHATDGQMFDGKFGITQWVDADPDWLIKNVGYLRTAFGQPATPPPDDLTQSFDDREQSYSGYAKANFGFDAGPVPVSGNIGLKIVDTQAHTDGYTLVITDGNGVITPTSSDKSTIDWLPSLNVKFDLQDDLLLRLAASQTVTHPTFPQLNPGLTLSASTATLLGSGSGGNPNLAPVKSENIDLSLEYYFGPQSALTGAVFYRQIDGYIQAAVTEETINGIDYQITRPVNAPSGHIDGVEIGYTQFFDFLPGFLSGLGAQANATFVDGNFQNISKWSYNLVGIYEKGPYSLRVAYNWRDGFNVGPAPGGGMQPGTIFAKSQPWLDLSASYQMNDRFTVTVDATNLLNSNYQDYFGNPMFPRDTRRFDQTVSIGVRFRL